MKKKRERDKGDGKNLVTDSSAVHTAAKPQHRGSSGLKCGASCVPRSTHEEPAGWVPSFVFVVVVAIPIVACVPVVCITVCGKPGSCVGGDPSCVYG